MSKTRVRVILGAVFASALAIGVTVMATGAGADAPSHLRARLDSFQETPSLNSNGHGTLDARVGENQITFKLTYSDLTGNPLVAHIHVGQRGVAGGVSVFFCGGGGQPSCPAATSGTVTGTITPANVVGPTTQGFNMGDLASVLRAADAGVTYANVHTPMFPNGEIRGQINDGNGHDGHHEHGDDD
jgi:hypothetical protein